jgi:hypothetical protein
MFADMNWGDPIAAAQPPAGKPSAADIDANSTKTCSGTEEDEIKADRNPGQGRDKGRGMVGSGAVENGARGASSTAQASELDFEVLVGGPGESWANPHIQVVW